MLPIRNAGSRICLGTGDVLRGGQHTAMITARPASSAGLDFAGRILREQPAPDVDRIIRTLPCFHFAVDQSTHWRQTGFIEYNLDQTLKCSSPAGTIPESRYNKRTSANRTHSMSLPHFHAGESVGTVCHMFGGILPA
jgi:hypothetical protein